MTNQYSESEITKMINSYKKKQLRDKKKYDENKDNEDFKVKNRARAKAHYEANKEMKQKTYKKNKEVLNCRSLYNYYKYHSRINEFIVKFPEKCEVLQNHGFVIDNDSGSDSEVPS
tara:strand:+ start:6937 stop:7284 length:348 start_codon:yes stop_codon:yes gene_type:complete